LGQDWLVGFEVPIPTAVVVATIVVAVVAHLHHQIDIPSIRIGL